MPKDRVAAGVILPEREVVLLSGARVIVRPWPIRKGRLLVDRVIALVERLLEHRRAEALAAGEGEPPRRVALASDLLDVAFEEVFGIVRDTVDYSDAQMEALTFEDLLTLTEAVLEVCLIRGEEGGVLGKLARLVDRTGLLVVRMAASVQRRPTTSSSSPSTSSSGRATTATTSSGGARRVK
jgi:hypothetical protein